jgi:hypothetical protein
LNIFQAFSSLGRHHPDLIGDPVVVEISQKHGVNPEVDFALEFFYIVTFLDSFTLFPSFSRNWHCAEIVKSGSNS